MLLKQLKAIVLISIFFTSVICHKCGKMKDIPLEAIDLGNNDQHFNEKNRNLANSQIRITFDDDGIIDSGHQEFYYQIRSAVQTALNFYKQFVKPKIPISKEFVIENCADYPLSDKQKDKTISNSDMHFYIFAVFDTESWVARSGACKFQTIDNRPVAGIIEFNAKYLEAKLNDFLFEDLVEVTIHEIFHSLVFSKNLFGTYHGVDPTQFEARPGQNTWIKFPNVLKFVQDHFGCQEITQVQLEDGGGDGSAGSHWERSLFQNDIMTASTLQGDNTWSGINNALLLDSGWYDVDMPFHDRLFWGKNKGCDFYKLKCFSKPMPEEFCDPDNLYDTKNSFHFTGGSVCTNKDYFFDSSCSYKVAFSSEVCYNTENNTNQASDFYTFAGSVYGWDSKSVTSNLSPIGQFTSLKQNDSQCYPSKCVENAGKQNIEFYIGQKKKKVVCQQDEQVIQVEGYIGQLICPVIANFCERQYNCPNFCNSGGFCMNQKCFCTPGFSGANCECGNGTYYSNNGCQKCTTKNCYSCDENNKCVSCIIDYSVNQKGECTYNFGFFLYFKLTIILLVLLF